MGRADQGGGRKRGLTDVRATSFLSHRRPKADRPTLLTDVRYFRLSSTEFRSPAADRRARAGSCRAAWSPDRSGGANGNRPRAPAGWLRPDRVQNKFLPHVLRDGLDDVGEQFAPGAQPLGEFRPAFLGTGDEQDDLHMEHGARPSGTCRRAIHGQRKAAMKSARILVRGEEIEVALDRLLDVILEHGEDQLVLAGEIRIERPARETGRGRDRFDAAGVVPCPRRRGRRPRTVCRGYRRRMVWLRLLTSAHFKADATRYNYVSSCRPKYFNERRTEQRPP